MAEFAAWGPEQAGERLADFDRVNLLQKGLTALHTAGQIEQMPIDARLKTAHADFYDAEAAAKRSALEKNQKFLAGYNNLQQAGKIPEDPIAKLGTFGQLAESSGDLKTAREMYNAASLMQGRKATEAFRQAQAGRLIGQMQADHAKRLGDILGTAQDQRSYEQAIMIAQSQGVPVDQLPIDFEQARPIVKQLTNAAMGTAKRIELEIKENEAEARNTVRESRLETDSYRRRYLKAATAAAEERTARLGKAGAGKEPGLGMIKKMETDTRLAMEQAGINLPDTDATIAASTLAADAQQRVKANPALTLPQAISQVVQEAKARGDFAEVGGMNIPLVGNVGAKTRYQSQQGVTPKAPIILPKKINPAELKTGKYYKAPNGGVYKYLGNDKWEQSSLSTMDHLAMADGADAEDDGDDDDEGVA